MGSIWCFAIPVCRSCHPCGVIQQKSCHSFVHKKEANWAKFAAEDSILHTLRIFFRNYVLVRPDPHCMILSSSINRQIRRFTCDAREAVYRLWCWNDTRIHTKHLLHTHLYMWTLNTNLLPRGKHGMLRRAPDYRPIHDPSITMWADFRGLKLSVWLGSTYIQCNLTLISYTRMRQSTKQYLKPTIPCTVGSLSPKLLVRSDSHCARILCSLVYRYADSIATCNKTVQAIMLLAISLEFTSKFCCP